MKCDVCGTKIPIGQHECPRCGYKTKEKKESVYDGTSTNHEHIKRSQPKLSKDFVNQMKFGKEKTSFIVIAVIVIAILASVGLFAIPKFMDRYIEPYQKMSLQEQINRGYDSDETLQAALNGKEETERFLNKMGWIYHITEEVNTDNDENNYVSLIVDTEINDIDFELILSYYRGDWGEKSVRATFESPESLHQMDHLDIDSDTFSEIVRHIGIQYDAIKEVEKILPKMEARNSDHSEYFGQNDTLSIYTSDSYNEKKNNYLNSIHIHNRTRFEV